MFVYLGGSDPQRERERDALLSVHDAFDLFHNGEAS